MAGTSSAKKRFALLPGHDETVIASQRVGAERRPMTGSAKQSMVARAKLDCFVASLLAMTASKSANFHQSGFT